jgi:predicted Holliday junction resolvase-like endonuclease
MTVANDTRLLAMLVLGLALFALLLVAGLAAMYRIGRARGRGDAERDLPALVSDEREDAVRRSRAVLSGQAAEQLAPWLPGFPWDPAEVRFIGKPVDFLVFRGASSGEISEVVFVEVKTGTSSLSKVERSLRDAVKEGRVRWEEYRPPA